MADLAHKYSSLITEIRAIANTSLTIFVFEDGSRFKFSLTRTTTILADGPQDSSAREFMSQVKSFGMFVHGYGFTFRDDSKMNITLRDMSKPPMSP